MNSHYMHNKELLFILFFFIVTTISAQTGGHIDYSPKTPEAAAFEQVAEIPVGNYTGTANISIPLYTIECGDIKVPISLEYLGTAIRVNQEASWVGLNWMLNAGGAITTQLSPNYDVSGGFPNEGKRAWNFLMNRASLKEIYPNGGAFNYKIGYKLDGQHPDRRGRFGKNWFYSSNCYITEDTIGYYNDLPQQVYNITLNHGDGEAPKYHATFLGHTITFVWDRIKEEYFITGEAQGYKIEGRIGEGPTITDGNGVKYEFKAIEMGMPEGSNVDPYFSRFDYTYYLSKIISPSGRVVQFTYLQLGDTHPVYSVNEQLFDKKYPCEVLNSFAKKHYPMAWDIVDTDETNRIRTLSQYYTLKPLRLTSIETENQIIKFVLSGQKRLDIRGDDYSLQRIEVYRKENTNSEKLIKRFCFNYSYSAKNIIGGNMVQELLRNEYSQWLGNDDFMYCRLMLNKVWEEGVNEAGTVIKKPAYIFSYNPANLPCKASAAVDYWGYYNGKENLVDETHTLIPRGRNANNYDGTYSFPGQYVRQKGADRLADENYMKAGMLTSIQYPTGGMTTFEYEPHDFTNYNYKEASVAVSFDPICVYTASTPNYTRSGRNYYKDQKEFDINTDGYYTISCNYCKNGMNRQVFWRELVGKGAFLQRIPDETNHSAQMYPFILTPSDTTEINSQSINKSLSVQLTKGRYLLKLTSFPDENDYQGVLFLIDATIRYDKTKQPAETSIGGGLRIKSVTITDNGIQSKTSYDYTDEKRNSSGMLMAPAIYAREKILVYQPEKLQKWDDYTYIYPHTAKRIQYWTASGSNMAPPASINVTYGRVTVTKTGNGSNNGKSIFEYHNKRWEDATMCDYMRRIEDPVNGKVEKQMDYDNLGKLVRKTENTYTMDCVESRLLSAVIENIYFGPTKGEELTENVYANVLGGGCMQIYLYPSVQFSVNKIASQTTEFVGQQGILHTIETVFNQKNHLEATIKESSSRAGESILTELFYPVDLPNNNIATSLKSRHIINVPMEKVSTFCKNSNQLVTSAERTAYSSMGLPIAIYSFKNLNTQRSNYNTWTTQNGLTDFEQITSITYNSVGKPRGVTEYGQAQTIYIWGYNNEYPIAMIKGASQDAVISKLGGQSAVNNLENALVPTMNAEELFSILSDIQGALVTVYEFKPLIGVTKTIMPNGTVNTYEYDALGRLVKIYDHHGTVTQQFQYNYKRQ